MNSFYKYKKVPVNWRKFRNNSFLLFFLTMLGASLNYAQVSGYSFAQTSGAYTEITGGTVLGTATANTTAGSLDTAAYPVTLPFPFTFNGTSYNDISINTNGYLTFGTTASSGTTPISATTAWGGVVSAFAGDLNSVFDINGRTGEIRWEATGTAPNRVFTAQWKNFRQSYSTSTTVVYVFNFQIKLYETTNVVSTVYSGGAFLVGSTASSGTRQIGLRGATNTDFNNRSNTTTESFNSSVAGSLNNSSQAFNNVNAVPGMPQDGLTYTWTPNTCFAPTAVTTSNISTTSVDFSWTAASPVPTDGYQIYYSTTAGYPSATAVPQYTTSSTTFTANNLTPGTTYYFWVRSACSSSSYSGWVQVPVLSTLCVAFVAPYSENFDTTSTGTSTNNNAPNCWSYVESTGFVGYGYVSTGNGVSPSNNYYLYNSSATTGSQMLVSPQTTNLSDGLKWTKFSAKASAAGVTLEVGTMSDPTDPTTFTIIGAPISLTTTHQIYTVIIPSGTSKHLAFKHGMGGTTRSIYLDDITIENAPTCYPPTGLAVSATTTNSGNLTWTAPAIGTPTNYTIYYSTVNTAPTSATVLNSSNSLTVTGTSATISGLNPSTTYYVWIRSSCSSTDNSSWTQNPVTLATLCQPPAITGTTGQTVCLNGTATLTATAAAGATINWYSNATGGTSISTGSSYTTPALTSTTNYYVSASTGSTASAGFTNAVSTSGYSLEAGVFFDALTGFTIEGVYVYPTGTGAGTVEIALQNGNVSPATTIQSVVVNLTGTAAPYVKTFVPLNFIVPAGTNYKLMMLNRTGLVSNLVRESGTSWGSYPITLPGVLSITNGNCCSGNTTSTAYYYFYDWQVSTKCESARTMVTATVDPTCDALGTTEVSTEKAITVYPNPFTDVLNISNANDLKSVTVIDASGRVVRTIEKPARQINLGDLKAGAYILKIDYKNGSAKTVKVIKR